MEKRRINVRAVIWRDGKILAVKHKDERGRPDDFWAIPGGGLDPMEALHDGVKREVFEELGVKTDVGTLLATQQFHSRRSGFDEELEFFFAVNDSPLFDEVDLAKTSYGLEELADVRFVDPKEVSIKPDFLSTLDIESIIKSVSPVSVNNYL